MRVIVAVLIGVSCLLGCAADHHPEIADTPAPITGPWLGQQRPGTTPELFLATGLAERDTAWTPDGGQLFYSLWERRRGLILTRAEGQDGWSEPEFAPFSGKHSDLEPFISADGSWLYFISKRPMPGETAPTEAFNLWRVPRTDGGWGEPENLGPAVNSPGPEFNSLIAPDGSWLIFGTVREGDIGGGDNHIAFRGPDGAFLPAVNMGEPLNSPALDYCPALSPGGSIIFFTSSRVPDDAPKPTTFAELEALLGGPNNGRDNIWWVSAEVIEDLRQQVLETS